MQAVHRVFHQPLSASDFLLEVPERGWRFPAQGQELEIHADQGLGDLVMQFAADALAFFLLHLENPVGQAAQLLLHLARLIQQSANLGGARRHPLFEFRVELADFLLDTLALGNVGEVNRQPGR